MDGRNKGETKVIIQLFDKRSLIYKNLIPGKLATVKFLLESGACIDAQDIDGQTVLHKAVENKNHELATNLLELCPKLALIKDTNGRLATEPAAQ